MPVRSAGVLLCCLAMVGAIVGGVRADLVHRYSFDGDAADAIGGAHGTLVNRTQRASFSGGQVAFGNDGSQWSHLDNGDYLDLPNGLISSLGGQMTLEIWATWNGPAGSSWQRFFDFGISDEGEGVSPGGYASTYIFLTPRSGDNTLRFGYRYGPTSNEQWVERAQPAPVGSEVHVAVTWDETAGKVRLYVDGAFVEEGPIHFSIASHMMDLNNWLSRSQWGDPLLNGSINELRLYNHALSSAEVAANFAAGPDQIVLFGPAQYLSPADGMQEAPLTVTLRWQSTNSSDLAAHRIYVGTDFEAVRTATPASTGIYRGALSAAFHSYVVTQLPMDTTCYWRIDEVSFDGLVVPGPVWSFRTVNLRASQPEPADGSEDVYIATALSWRPGAGAQSHNVYFGESADNLSLAAENLSENRWQPPVPLGYQTRYYWRVDERTADGGMLTGDVWTFTTQQKPAACLTGDLNGDCRVDIADLALFADAWASDVACSGYDCADFDGGGRVDGEDLNRLAANWRREERQTVVINEIHYHPDNNTEAVEFIELFNPGPRAVDLSGWKISDGVSYVFPWGTEIVAGGYLLVAEDPAAVLARFGAAALGPFEGNLKNEGERIALESAWGDTVDEVTYSNEFPWPISADGEGASMELIHPGLDNDLGGSWRPSGYREPAETRHPKYLVPRQSDRWRWRKGDSEPAAGWYALDYVEDGTWQTGKTSIGYGDGDDWLELKDMRYNYVSVYLRHTFEIATLDEIPSRLDLGMYVDDGSIVWINGVKVASFHVASDSLPYNANPGLVDSHEAGWEIHVISNPAALLRVGVNVIAIHAVNDGADSSDFSIDASLYASYDSGASGAAFGPPTPGRMNSVYTAAAPPQIRQVNHSPEQPAANDPIRITAKVTDPDGVADVKLMYQIVLPGSYIPAFLPVEHDSLLADPFQPMPPNPAFEDPANWTVVAMRDDGTGGDVFAGDDVYTAIIPGQINRTLVRYRIQATDNTGAAVRVPYHDDDSLNFACFVYNGVPPYVANTRSVHPEGAGHVYSAEIMNSLPVYHLITRAEDLWECYAYDAADQQPHDDIYEHQMARRAYNWEGALVYEGKVYDHIGYRLRGANGRYHLAGKRSMRFRFNRGNRFEARGLDGEKFPQKWKTLVVGKMFGNRMVGNFGLTEILNMQLWNLVGVPASDGFWFHLRVVDGVEEAPSGPNGQYYGDFWGMSLALENYDSMFLDSHGLPKGNLYKLSDRVFDALEELRYQGPEAVSDGSDYENIRWNLNASASSQWIQDHLDCQKWYWYHAVSEAIRHYDVFSCPFGRHCMKNMAWYFYPDYRPENNGYGRLWFLPYDTDDTWGPYWNYGTDHAKVAIFEVNHENNPIGPGKPELKIQYRNTIREFRDLVWQPDVINPMIDDLYARIADFVYADRDRWRNAPYNAGSMDFGTLEDKVADMKRFAWEGGKAWEGDFGVYPGSAAHLDSLAAAEGDNNMIPHTPTVSYGGPEGFPINRLVFTTTPFSDPQGPQTFAAVAWRAGEVTDESNPNYDPREKRRFEINAVWESGELAEPEFTITVPASALKVGHTYRVRCRMKDNTGRWSHWSAPVQFIAGEPVPEDILTNLRVTEVMYNPAPPAVGDKDDFEFIELKNGGSTTLDLSRVEVVDGVTFRFADSSITSLAPGQFVLLVRNRAAFELRYGTSLRGLIAGQYAGGLKNDGERIVVQDTEHGVIVAFEYSDDRGWPAAANGAGHSLVPLDRAMAGQNEGLLDYGGNWRASTYMHGSPGADDPPPSPAVLINEIAANTDYSDPSYPDHDSNDWIELYNVADTPLLLSDWYLSDDKANPKKWRIGDVLLDAGGRISFDEVNDFHNPITSGFGLDKGGEELILSYLPGDTTDRIVDYVRFMGQDSGTSLGRFPDGTDYWFAMPPSRDGVNLMPQSHVVIGEIMYHPAGAGEEYIELHNPTGQTAVLSGAAGPWRLDGEIAFEFPAQTAITAGGRLFIVGFDPVVDMTRLNAFVASYNTGPLTPGTDIVGPWDGALSNGGGRVALERPLPADPATPWVIVDEVIYADRFPWPSDADGRGYALRRISTEPDRSGNDPANWQSVARQTF